MAGRTRPPIDEPEWLSIAASLKPALSSAMRHERREILEEAARKFDRAPQTLRRMCNAFAFIELQLAPAGLKMEQIKAAIVSVEVLARIHALDPASAADLRVDVLLGSISFRALLAKERTVRSRRDAHLRRRRGWEPLAHALYETFFETRRRGPMPPWRFAADRSVYTEVGRLLKVDWEIDLKTSERCATFLSPQCVFSTGRRWPVEDLVPRVAVATFSYEQVLFLAWDDEEMQSSERTLGLLSRCSPIPVRAKPMVQCPYVNANIEVLRLAPAQDGIDDGAHSLDDHDHMPAAEA